MPLAVPALFFFLCYLDKIVGNHNVINDSVYHAWVYLSFSFPFVRDRVLSATSSPLHMIVFSTLPCLLSYCSSLPPLLPSSHLSQHSRPISASLVSSSPPHVTMPLSSVVCYLPSFLLVLLTVACSSPVSLSSSSALLSALVTLAIFRTQLFRTLVTFVVVVRSLPMFPFRIAMPISNHTSARDLALQSF